MKVNCFFSSPDGDIPLSPDDLKRPFLISPENPHPFLLLGDYFGAIEHFIFYKHKDLLIEVLGRNLNRPISPGDIRSAFIRSEKHGAFYHIASVEILIGLERLKFAVSSAFSKSEGKLLRQEYDLLCSLGKSDPTFLPEVYFIGESEFCDGSNRESFSILLAEWFEGYNEWHISFDEGERKNKISIWDYNDGSYYFSDRESKDLFRQASKILTRYYDINTCRRIYPWHNASGDFIVKIQGGKVDVRLTTVRQYEPFIAFQEEEKVSPLMGLLYFFLDTSIRIRLDRLDGVGKPVWADRFALDAAIQGFFEGLRIKDGITTSPPGLASDALNLLKEFNQGELRCIFTPLMDFYQKKDSPDHELISENLDNHIEDLFSLIGNFSM